MENNVDEIKRVWGDVESIFKDGKVDLTELPLLLQSVGLILNMVASILTVLNIDPKINIIFSTIVATLSNLSVALKNEIPQIKKSWDSLETIMEDGEIEIGEIKEFILSLSNLLESVIQILLPFINVEFSNGMFKLGNKRQRLIRWFENLEKLKE